MCVTDADGRADLPRVQARKLRLPRGRHQRVQVHVEHREDDDTPQTTKVDCHPRQIACRECRARHKLINYETPIMSSHPIRTTQARVPLNTSDFQVVESLHLGQADTLHSLDCTARHRFNAGVAIYALVISSP